MAQIIELGAQENSSFYKDAKTFEYEFENHFVKQQYLPDKKISARYYEPTTQGAEVAIKERLEKFWHK